MEDLQKRELALGRERGLRFVQEIDPLLETMGEEGEEGLPVRLCVERLAAVGEESRDLLDVGREVVEALGAEEKPFGHLGQPGEPERARELRAVPEGLVVVVPV